MTKNISLQWWREMVRFGKQQQRAQKKLIKLMQVTTVPTPPRIRKPARSTLTVALPERATSKMLTLANASSCAVPHVIKTVIRPAAAAKGPKTPGKWRAFYYTALSGDPRLPLRRMAYWLYLPALHRVEKRRIPRIHVVGDGSLTAIPLVVMLHGCEQSATQFAQGTRMNQLAEQHGFAVLYPQQSLRGHPNRCWHWYEKSTQEGGGDVQSIAAIIHKVTGQYGLDSTRVYIAGLSAGAAMANIVALNHPHLIAAVGLHSGPVFGAGHSPMGAFSVMQSGGSSHATGSALQHVIERERGRQEGAAFPCMPAILLHGRADTVVRSINQVQLVQQFQLLNQLSDNNALAPRLHAAAPATPASKVSNRTYSYRTQDFLRNKKLLLRVCEIQGLNHAWSGGDCSLKYNACTRPDASRMLWDFFKRHQRLAPPPLMGRHAE